MLRRTTRLLPLALPARAAPAGCGDDKGSGDLDAQVIETLRRRRARHYDASLVSAHRDGQGLDAFLAAPRRDAPAAKQAWLDARDDYGLTEAYRFYGGPIDDEKTGTEGFINAWPLD
jgi:putative iron-regulated protein